MYDDVDVSMVMFNCNGIHGSCMATFGQALKESSGNIHMCRGVNSHYFHVVGMVINPIVGVYMPITRMPY